MAQRTARFDIASLPESQAQIASRIIESVPRASRSEALRIIERICERYGDKSADALMHFEAIVRSENFRPSCLGTVSLIVERSGTNATPALREFSILIGHEKFNRYVHETVRLAAARAGENTHEALRALHFVLSNPSFTQRSLNLALPDTFVRFLDQAIRGAGDADYLGIRVLGDMFANPNFGPDQFNARFSRTVGSVIRRVRELSAPNQYYGLEALGTVLGNGAVRPEDISIPFSENLCRSVGLVIEYTRAIHGSDAGPKSAIDQSMRTLNLILGNRAFSPDLLADGGILRRIIEASTTGEAEALTQFLRLMRSSRQHPQAMGALGSLVAAGHDPTLTLHALNALLSNTALAPMLAREDFVARFGALLSISSGNIGSRFQRETSETNMTNRMSQAMAGAMGFDPGHYLSTLPPQMRNSPAAGFLCLLLQDQRINQEIFDRVSSALLSLGPNADIAALCLAHFINNPSFRPQMLDQAFLSNLAALANQAAASSFDFRVLGSMFTARHFRPSLIDPNGLIPHILRTRSTDAEDIYRMLNTLMSRRAMSPELEAVFRESVSITGRSGKLAVDTLGVILQNAHISPNTYPMLLIIVRSMGTTSDAGLSLYSALFSNPALVPRLTDPTFVRRLCALMNRTSSGAGRQGRDAIQALGLVLSHRSFRPDMLGQIDRILDQAGPSAFYVLQYLQALQTTSGIDFRRAMRDDFLDFLCRTAVLISSGARSSPAEAHSAFSSLIGEMKGEIFSLLDHEDDIRAYLGAVARGAGPMASIALQAIIPRLPHINLDEDDGARLGSWIRTYLQRLPDNTQRAAAITGLSNMLVAMSRNSDLYDIFMDNPRLFERGRVLAESLIADRPVGLDVILNFAYGIQRIGEARVRALHQSFGLRYFARYSDGMLEQLYRNRERRADPSRPTVFVTFPHWDDNGAFYGEGRRLDELLDTHNVVIFEAGTERGFYQAAYDFRMRYGRTRDIIIGGHGSPSSIRLGSSDETGLLDMTDADELRVLRDVLGQEPRVILVSCSTGQDAQSIGAMISRVIGATLMAPREPSGVSRYDVDSQGRITVQFRSERGFFFEGLDLSDLSGRRTPP